METLIFIVELIGTVAFSISGAMIGLKKKMDVFGVAILGLTPAVGGGVIRDILLGLTPPQTFRHPVYALLAIVTAVFIFNPAVRRWLTRGNALYERVLFVMDTLGLAIFTQIGIRIAFGAIDEFNGFLLIFVGVITGVGGGVLRDLLAGNTPYIFLKHIYASASLAGAAASTLLWRPLGESAAMAIGFTLIAAIRLISAHYKLNLPIAKDVD